MRGLIVAGMLLLAGCAPSAATPGAAPATVALPPAPAPPPLELTCAGALAQGGVVVCRTRPGATFSVDGEERGLADAAGWLVAGFDRDAPPTASLVVRSGDETKTLDLAIAPRSWSIQRVNNLPKETVTPSSPEVLARIQREAALKEEARKSRAPADDFLDAFIWPVHGIMSGAWGNQRVLNGEPRSPHYGIDIAAPEGTPVIAPADGVVAMANPDMHFEGGLVMIDHGQGLITYYLHMSRLDVAVGARVTQGQQIGLVGKKGRATGPHLCWRMRWRDRNLDPSLAVQGLAAARATFAAGPAIDPGAAPPNFTPWTPSP
jgi:hypothetical protein